jgi:hypothetical protein
MPKVFIICVVTGRPIDTGIDINERHFACPLWDSTRVVEGQGPVAEGEALKS